MLTDEGKTRQNQGASLARCDSTATRRPSISRSQEISKIQFLTSQQSVKKIISSQIVTKMYPGDISIHELQALRHVPGAYELMAAIRANKSREEIMRIMLRNPRLMASYIVSRDNYYKR